MATITFVHEPIGEEIRAIGGGYRLFKEQRTQIHGMDILYQVGVGIFDTTCCGAGGCSYALIQGKVIDWKSGQNDEGISTSTIELLSDEEEKEKVKRYVENVEGVQQVQFRSS